MVSPEDESLSFATPPTGQADESDAASTFYSVSEELNPRSPAIRSDPNSRTANPSMDYLSHDYLTFDARVQMGLPVDDSPRNIHEYKDTSDAQYSYHPNPSWKKYTPALQALKPVRFVKSRNSSSMGVDEAGMFSFISYSWLTRRMWRAYRQGFIPLESLPKCSRLEACDVNCQRIEYLWQKELEKRGPEKASFQRVVWRFVRTRMLLALFLFVINLITGFVGPTIFMRKLLEYAQKPEVSYWEGVGWLSGLFVMECLRVIIFAAMWAINYRTALRLRSACLSLLFCKVMRLRNLGDKSIGEFINLFANDGNRIFEFVTYGPLIVGGPVVAIGGIIFIGTLLGIPALAGMAAFILFYPFQYLISRLSGYYRRETILVTDERVRFMNEILNSIRIIKLYAWEEPFARKIGDIRKKERKLLEKAAYVQSTSIAMAPTVPIIAAIITFLAHIAAGNSLTAAEAFTVWGTYQALRFAFAIFPFALISIAQMKPSTDRMEAFPVMSVMYSFRPSIMTTFAGMRAHAEMRLSTKRLQAFTVMTIMCMLNFAFRVVPIYANQIVNGRIGFQRLQAVLLMEEKEQITVKPVDPEDAICVTNATFSWDVPPPRPNGGEKANKKKKTSKVRNPSSKNGTAVEERVSLASSVASPKIVYSLVDINFALKKGKLVGICGSVGSGKSSLISAILGQMRLIKGQVGLQGTCAYVSQQAWIINATVQDNILFGETLDPKRYYNAVFCCSLNTDIAALPAGDQTEIGERGVNLSGGQKQRVSLARAVYSDRDVYLLDDPLSAVDAHVGQHIFQHCIQGALKEKSVLLVTHQLQYLSSCDYILLMKDGQIAEHGTHNALMNAKKEYSNLIHTFLADEESPVSSDAESVSDVSISKTKRASRRRSTIVSAKELEKGKPFRPNGTTPELGKMIKAETMEKGSISTATYLDYMKASGGYVISFLVLLSFAINIGTTAFSSWWLSQWINEGSGGTVIYDPVTNETRVSDSLTDNPQLDMYQTVYGLSIIFILATSFIRSFAFMKATLRASSAFHEAVFTKVFHSPMSFFDVTPIGRIINIFSVDMDEIDVRLPFTAESFLQNLWVIIFSLLFVTLVFPWFLILLAIISVLFLILYTIFRVAIREMKRVESVSRSPIYSHVTATVQGLATIHAYGKEAQFINKFMFYMDENTTPYFLFNCGMRWLALRLDFLVVSITLITGLFVVLTHGNVPAAFAGLALSYASQLSGLFQYTVRLSTETEARFTSVERIRCYSQSLETEAPAIVESHRPPQGWPADGRIEFEDVTLRYRPGLPLVLKGLSFVIHPREKIGIVGRTGSGKSSLGMALFRLVEISSGRIFIDNLNIREMGVADLRSKMSLIPQDPIMFIGTVRYNLDPFNLYTDDDVWKALERTYMKEKILNLHCGLNAPVVENGDNFSIGERQLLCMARVLLRNSKILLLDEATASIDTETDSLIQTTIREAFVHCTILTIAHRLNTVLTCHRVMVMEDGKIVEMDKPSTLMSNPQSAFAKMMASATDSRYVHR